MDAFVLRLTGGNFLIKLVLLQLAAAVLVVFFLKKLLERELFLAMLERLARLPAAGQSADDVVVVTAGTFSSRDEARLRAVIKERFPQAPIVLGQDASLWGGLIVRAGGSVIDLSLSTKMKHLFRLNA